MPDTVESMLRAAIQQRFPYATDIAVLESVDLDGRSPARVRAFRTTWRDGGLTHIEQFVVKERLGMTVDAEEPGLLEALVPTQLPVPVVRHAELGELGSFMVLEYLPGRPLFALLQSAGMRWQLSALAFTFARALASIHALDWTRFVPWMADPEALPEEIVDQQIDSSWQDWEERIPEAPADLRAVFERALTWLDQRRPVEVSLCLNHGSFTPANVLIQDDEVSGILDWDRALVTDSSYDLALLPFEIERLGLDDDDAQLFLQAAFGAYLQSSPHSFGNLPFYTAARLLSMALDRVRADDLSGPDRSQDTPSLTELTDALRRTMAGGGAVPWRS